MTTWLKLTGEDPIQLVRLRSNAEGYADLREGFLRLIVIEKEFENDFFRIADFFLHEGGHYLDVGANYGLTALGAAAANPRIVAHLFEPNPELGRSIERSFERYPDLAYLLNRCAVSDTPGSVRIDFNPEHTGASHVTQEGGREVPCLTIDDYLRERDLDAVTLMKVDVEGYEQFVFRGASKALEERTLQAIYFEYCEKWLERHHPPVELLDFLQRNGYDVFYCRSSDFSDEREPSHFLLSPAGENHLPLVAVDSSRMASSTDLLALPVGVAVEAQRIHSASITPNSAKV